MRTRLTVAFSKLFGMVTRRRRETRLAEEVAGHLAELAARHEAHGLSPDDARLAARRDFGGVDQMRERYLDQHGVRWLDVLSHDVRHAIRRFRDEPWFSAAVILALAIGIGGSLSVVGAVTAISAAQPPFHDPDGVLSIGTVDDRGRRADVSWTELEEWRTAAQGFSHLAGFSGAFFTVSAEGRAAERVQGAFVSASTFSVLGVAPMAGRDISDEEDQPGAASVALVSESVATSLFGSASDAVGRSVTVDGVITTVVGVMANAVAFPLNGAFWRPLTHMPGLREGPRERRQIGAVGRLTPGTSVDAALAELTTIAARQPSTGDIRSRPTLTTFRERFLGRATDPVPLALLIVSGMVLLIGCATAATLLFARSVFRMEEVAMRLALGASRARVVVQLLIECGTCAIVAGTIGLVAARFALRRFGEEVAGAGLPPWVQFTVSGRVIAVAAAATCLATVFGGLAPAWRLTRSATVYLPGRSRVSEGRPTQRWIRTLIAANVALTLVLLSTSGYLLTGALALYRADQAVDTSGLITARLGLSGPMLSTPDARLAFLRRFVERLVARGELQRVTVTTGPPFSGAPVRQVTVETAGADGRDRPTARVVSVDADYFSTLGVRLLEGRDIASRDDRVPTVAVVNAAFAARYLGGRALGRRVQLASSATEAPSGPWLTVVGVSPSLRHSPRPDAEPAIYVPLGLDAPSTVFVMVRAGDGVPVADILRRELQAMDPSMALYGWQTVERMSEISRWTMRTVGGIVVILGMLALALSALGIYAVAAYAAGRRVKEVGIRLAIGANVPAVTRLLFTSALRPVIVGLAVGFLASWAASRALLALILEGSAVGTPMFVPAGALMAGIAAVAALVPARRIAASDPLEALRCD